MIHQSYDRSPTAASSGDDRENRWTFGLASVTCPHSLPGNGTLAPDGRGLHSRGQTDLSDNIRAGHCLHLP